MDAVGQGNASELTPGLCKTVRCAEAFLHLGSLHGAR